jgi:hypothetical protein
MRDEHRPVGTMFSETSKQSMDGLKLGTRIEPDMIRRVARGDEEITRSQSEHCFYDAAATSDTTWSCLR